MPELRVALFTDADVFAGTERHIFDLARGLRDQGVSVCVACPTPAPLAERAQEAGLEVVSVPKQGRVLDRNAVQTWRTRLREKRVDIVHAHNGRTALAAALAVQLAGTGHCIATQHFLAPDHTTRRGPQAAIYRAAHGWMNGRLDHCIAISRAVQEDMLARGEAPASKITLVPNGIAAPDVDNLPAPARVREELGLAPNTPLVLCAARLQKEKDVRTLVAAMPAVRAACPNAVCLIAGEGAEQAALQQQIKESGQQHSVRLLGFRADVLALMRACDVFVLPSLAEPFGLVLLEAMALARPVVSTAAGGPLDIVVPGETGLLVPPASPEALARALQCLLADAATRQNMGRRGQERFAQHFALLQMARATLKVYEQVMR